MQAPTRLILAGASAALLLSLAPTGARAAGVGPASSFAGLIVAGLAAVFAAQAWMAQQSGVSLPWSGAVSVFLLVGMGTGWGVWLWWSQRQMHALEAFKAPRRQRAASPARPAASIDIDDAQRRQLLDDAKRHFLQLQAAWDGADLAALAALTTPAMLAELRAQLQAPLNLPTPERGRGPNRTEVLSLEAELLGHEEWREACVATIEFSGMIREAPERAAAPFRELWMLARSKHGAADADADADWRLARHQALL